MCELFATLELAAMGDDDVDKGFVMLVNCDIRHAIYCVLSGNDVTKYCVFGIQVLTGSQSYKKSVAYQSC